MTDQQQELDFLGFADLVTEQHLHDSRKLLVKGNLGERGEINP